MKRMVFKGSVDTSSPIYKLIPAAINQNILRGSLVVNGGSGAAVATNANLATSPVWGVAAQDYTTGATVTADDVFLADTNPGGIYTMPYVGSTKQSVTNADIGKMFSLATNAYTCDLDAAGEAILECVSFNNENKTIDVKIKRD